MKPVLAAFAVLAGAAVSTAGATSLTPPYKDDRSDPQALIESYFNALNRKEFARAWSYYGEEKPAADFETFETDSQTVASVDLAVGEAEAEGAAGSVFYQTPVAIRIMREDGTEEEHAGCILARLVNPQIQGDPFRPMHIVRTTLQAASGPLESAMPASCMEN